MITFAVEREQPTVQDEKNIYVLLTDGATYRRYRALSVPAQSDAAQYVAGLNTAAMWNDGTPVPVDELIGTAAYIALQPIPFVYQTSKPIFRKEVEALWRNPVQRLW